MSLFSKQNKEVLFTPLNLDNPILVQVLGICSALAVTSQLKPALLWISCYNHHCILKCNYFNNAQYHSNTNKNYCSIGGSCCTCYNCKSSIKSICLRRECCPFSICWIDYYQLYSYGTTRSFRNDEQALA